MSTSQFRNRPHFFSTSLHITDFTILLLLAPANFVLFRRTTLISFTGNHCAPPVGVGVSTTRLRRLCRFRIAGLCRCRVRLCRSRSSRLRIAGLYRRSGCRRCDGCRGRTTRTGGGITLVGTLACVLHNLLGLDGQLVGRILFTRSSSDGCLTGRNCSDFTVLIDGSDLLVAGRPLDSSRRQPPRGQQLP